MQDKTKIPGLPGPRSEACPQEAYSGVIRVTLSSLSAPWAGQAARALGVQKYALALGGQEGQAVAQTESFTFLQPPVSLQGLFTVNVQETFTE